MYFSKRLLMYETNSQNNAKLDYGEVSQVITDKLINVNMGGSNYTLEAVSVASGYIPKVGDWVVIDWQNGNPIAKGSNETSNGYGLNDVNMPVIVSQSDLASGTINSDHIRTDSIESRHIQAGSITADAISANTITGDKIQANTITGDNISANSITGDKIQAGAITSDNIRAGSILGTDISANSITSVQLGANSVTAYQISANSVQTQHISANTITSQMIQAGAINSTSISANSISSDKIQANAVQTQHISANSVQANQISANAVQTQHISANTITTSQIKAGVITSNLISANTINAGHMQANSVTATSISANSVQTQHISANSIVGNQIQANSIQTQHISANTITTSQIQANAITSNLITANAINASHITSNAIQTQHISSNTITTNQIQANAVQAQNISANSIQTQHISANTITSGQIQANAITSNLITANAIQSQHISANVITGAMVQASTISGGNIMANAIQTQHISANTIVGNQVQANAINATHITANAITSTQVSANAIQAQHISSNSIQTRHISANTITTNMIQAGAITSNLITANAITSQMIQANAIQSFQISANAITSTQISANAVQAQHISANSIQTQHISANTITSAMIQAGAITATLITANAIQSQHISANAIQGYMISGNQVSANHIVAGAIQTNHISANTVNSSQIQANAINATHVTANAIQAQHISSNSIQTRHISANSIQSNMISANQVNATHISANSVLSNMISANQVQAQHISANSVQTQHVSANTIMGYQINASQISGNHIVAGSISTDHLAVGTVQQGLLGQYYTYSAGATNKFQNFKGSQVDTAINFNWGTGSPSIVGQNDYYAIRWQGFIQAPETGQYIFTAVADDTFKLVVNNTLIINQTAYASGNEQSGNAISLTQGNWYPFLAEYTEGTSTANVVLKWVRPSLTKEIVPQKYFSQGNTVIDGAQIMTGTITASSMQVGTITAQSGIIANAAITTANIASGNITSALIGVGEIKTANIASGNITNALIANATIDYTKIASVDASKITVGQLDGAIITANTISGGAIMAQTITGDRLKAGTIDTTQLKAGSVITSTIASGAITTDKIEAGAITGDSIRAGSITAEHISTVGLDAQLVQVYNSATGETLIGSGYLRVDGLDVGVVQSDNLLQNGLFLTSSSDYGYKRMNPSGEALLGNTVTGIGSHQVWKIDLTSGNVVKTINIPSKKPFDIGIHPTGNFAYITVQGDNTLVQLDLTQDILTNNVLEMGMGPARIKWRDMQMQNMDMKHFFVLNTDPDSMFIPDSLMVVDTPPSSVNGDLYVHHQIALGINPYDFVSDDSSKMTYVTMASEGDIVVLDTSSSNSMNWKVKGRIPISAFGTDNNHGDLPSQFGMQEVLGGDASAQYNDNSMSTMSGMGGMDTMSGYGASDGSLRKYAPHGIALSSDPNTLYVVDYANGELVVVDKNGNAPYNYLVGTTAQGSFNGSSSMSGMGGMTSGGGMSMGTSPASLKSNGEVSGGGPGNYYVRYRIPVGDSPDFIQVVNGKIFITLQGSDSIAVIDESAIINEINADNAYYGTKNADGSFSNWTTTQSMRTVNQPTVRMVMGIGNSPSFMKPDSMGMKLYVSISGDNKIAVVDTGMEMVTNTINVGTNPKGFDITPDGKYLYVANYGGVGDLSFIYPQGTYIGDPFMALEGGIMYQGADGWTPDRSDWTYDASGNIQSKATVEFHINEPLKNEGGYAKLTAFGIDTQYAQIEQDIINVENYSNGNNVVVVTGGRLVGNFDSSVWTPREGSFVSGTVHNVMIGSIFSGNVVLTSANASQYSVDYNYSQVIVSANAMGSGNWIQADYTAPNNIYFKTHNSSVEIAVDNGSSPNFATSFQVDEFVPNFVAVDNRQTSSFTPTTDGINDTYEGLEYSTMTNRALNIPSGNITSNCGIISGNIVVDGDTSSSHYAGGNPVSGGAYVKLDLGNIYMIGQIKVWHYYADSRTYHNTKTEVSEDGVNWTTVFNSAVSGEYAETSSGNTITFNALPVRYVRDWANGSTANTSNHWVEIQAFGDWKVEKGYTYPSNSTKAGQQIATNGIGFVSTDIPKAYVAMNVQINFTSWWWMTYVVGPDFGRIKIEMPTLMNSGHYLNQQSPFVNNVAHRHIMSFPPSMMVQQDNANGIEGGKHRVIIRQDSGKVTLDRLRFDDYQYYTRSTLSIPSESPATFTRYKVVAEQAKWYQGMGRQTTEGAYDTPRTNPDTGQQDYSVPIKYRIRVLSQLSPVGSVQERGTIYVTSAIFETGKQSTHWRRSEASDVYAGNKIQTWDSNNPMSTGIQSAHLADGAVRSSKILPNAVYDYHISNYARIQEHKLELNYPTHGHTNKAILDSIVGWAGTSGNYGTGNTMARGDHSHDGVYLSLVTGGTVSGVPVFGSGITSKAESHFSNGTYYDPAIGQGFGLKVSQGIATDALNVKGNITVTGNMTVTGTVDGVDVSVLSGNVSSISGNVASLSGTVYGHIGSGGSAHAVAISGGANGFIDGANYGKLLRIQDNSINQTTADGRYYIKNQSVVVSTDNVLIGADTGAQRMGIYKKAGYSPVIGIVSGGTFNVYEMNTNDLSLNISGTSLMNIVLSASSSNFTYMGNSVATQPWVTGNYYTQSYLNNILIDATETTHGFMSVSDKIKMDGIQSNAINQTTADGRYLNISGGALSGSLSITGNITITGTVDGVKVSALNNSYSVTSGNVTSHIGSGGSAHAVAVSGGANGFIDGANYGKLLRIQDNAINQSTADGRYLQLNGGTLTGGLKTPFSSNGVVIGNPNDLGANQFGLGIAIPSGSTLWGFGIIQNGFPIFRIDNSGNITGNTNFKINGGTVWTSSNLADPATQTWISGNYYNSSTVDTKLQARGDVFQANANTFTNTNTFTNAGLSIKIQPSGSVANTTKLMQVNNTTGAEIFSVNYSGGVVVAGDLTVTGQTKYAGTTQVNGDYSISGNMFVSGNTTLGNTSTDTTTVNGTLVVNGNIQEVGYYQEVHRRPLFGIAGDLQFQTNSTTFDSIVMNYDPTIYGNPTVQTGATRYYRLYVIYSDDINSSQASGGQMSTLRYSGNSYKDFTLPWTWGDVNARRDWYSTYFSDLPTGHATIYSKLAQAGNNLGIRWIELIAYDKF